MADGETSVDILSLDIIETKLIQFARYIFELRRSTRWSQDR